MSSNSLKVKENVNLVRDNTSGAILNTDLASVMSYKIKKNEINKVKNIDERIKNLESDISDIKTLLQNIVNGNSAR